MSQTLFYFDVVIACVAVLVMATSMVLTLNQLVLATLGKRRKILESSLANLFKDLGLETEQAAAVAKAIVEDPRIEQQGGSVVTREQLVEMLLEHAAKSDEISTKLKDKLGVTDPGKTLVSLRNRVLQLEAASPELADHVRRTQAIVESAVNAAGTSVMEGIAKVMGDFDRVCDRMTMKCVRTPEFGPSFFRRWRRWCCRLTPSTSLPGSRTTPPRSGTWWTPRGL